MTGGETAAAVGGRRAPVHRTTVVVVAIGTMLTILLVLATRSVRESNENRLLRQRVREAAAVLTAALPGIQTPLAAAAEVIEETSGADQQAFRRLMSPLVNAGRPYVSASLWQTDNDNLAPVLVVGSDPKLAIQPPEVIRAFLQRSARTNNLAIIGLLEGDDPRLGYSLTSTGSPVRFVAYAEAALPPTRTAVVPSDSAFSGLDNAVYLGAVEDPTMLLTASTRDLPLGGRRASERVDFGDASLLLVMSPTGELGGALLAALAGIVGGVGLLTTIGSATLVEWLLRRRDDAVQLAAENSRLYAEQRSVARALQQSLLPERLPEVAGLELAVRYLPGTDGVDIGGDWYDVIPVPNGCVMIVVGDVSGRGLAAGTLMASLRYAVRAFASQGDSPSEVLTKLTRLVDLDEDGHFATVLCAVIDISAQTMTFANAGHPNPLLLEGESAVFVETSVGVPVGVTREAEYAAVTVPVGARATLLAFTDGLFERRGETVDVGLERLRRNARGHDRSLEDVLTELLEEQARSGTHDDTAILGVRWRQ